VSGPTTVLAQIEPASWKPKSLGFFLVGFFALLYHWSGSLYAPLICHLLNNMVTCSVGL
jgi:hypothetical protein